MKIIKKTMKKLNMILTMKAVRCLFEILELSIKITFRCLGDIAYAFVWLILLYFTLNGLQTYDGNLFNVIDCSVTFDVFVKLLLPFLVITKMVFEISCHSYNFHVTSLEKSKFATLKQALNTEEKGKGNDGSNDNL